jgi:hypothetical protein
LVAEYCLVIVTARRLILARVLERVLLPLRAGTWEGKGSEGSYVFI